MLKHSIHAFGSSNINVMCTSNKINLKNLNVYLYGRPTLLLAPWSSPSLESPSCTAEAGFRELRPTSQEKPAATCSVDGPAELCATC